MDGVLAENSEIGRVLMCGHCRDVHVVCGPVSLRFPPEAFLALVHMLQTAAAHPAVGGAPAERGVAGFRKWDLFQRQ